MSNLARQTATAHGVRIHLGPSSLGPKWLDITADTGIVYAASNNEHTWQGMRAEISSVRVGQHPNFATPETPEGEWLPLIVPIIQIDHDIRAACKVCSCTLNQACITEDGPCYWAGINLCSGCEGDST